MNLPYTVRTFEDFIKVDIATGDSDPMYWLVARAYLNKGHDWAIRFSLGMLAYYHAGIAAKGAELKGDDFWKYLRIVYDNAPRGTERRHFRGAAGWRALQSMEDWSPIPENFFQKMPGDYKGIVEVCQTRLSGFGPYFQLKLADYMMTCTYPIKGMNYLARVLPNEPAEAAKLLRPGLSSPLAFDTICTSVSHKGILAAPWFDRTIGPAEVETSLCGWKTTKFKGNWFGADIAEKHRQIREAAPELREWLPPIIPKDIFEIQL